MPNHVRNIVKFKNLKPDDVDFILNTIGTEIETEDGKVKEYGIDFNKIISEPLEESHCAYDCIITDKKSGIEIDKDRPWFNWYKWRNKYWGTKWGAYDCYVKKGKSYIIFVFSTAWNCPYPVIRKLGLLGYDIEVKYADEDIGNNCGKMVFRQPVYETERVWREEYEVDLPNPVAFARRVWDY